MSNDIKTPRPVRGKVRTPIQSAKRKVLTAAIAAFISAGVTAIVLLIAIGGTELIDGLNIFAFADVALLIILAVLLLALKSRIAAIILLVYFAASKAMQYIADPSTIASSLYWSLFFLGSYITGIVGTFDFHKLKKQEKSAQLDTPTYAAPMQDEPKKDAPSDELW